VDAKNLFETRTTSFLTRLEWLAGLVLATGAAILHLSEIRWWLFIGLFVIIDVIGYIPGAIAYRLSSDKRIGRGYYLAYNTMHSLVTWGLFAALWAWLVKPEWALLALPIHLLGDRALFGNSLKPFGVPFEPSAHPAFVAFEREYATAGQGVSRGDERRAHAVRA
jgi:hypothetical protein